MVDVVISEEAEASMEIPSHPVEKGAKISDHAWRLPTTLTMECINGDVTGTWQALTDLMAQAEPFDILNGFDLFESMMIERINPRRDVTLCQVISFSVELKEVVIVETATTAGNAGTGGDQRGQGKTTRGQVQAREVSTASGRGAQVGAAVAAAPTASSIPGLF
ncbi:hypothetical protein FF100_04940 [Methylobacterium terricola]|uniref:Dit-like phage tail protein N-terminal domain-containing protein n=1 Tax=Methylobacterium terricola TaxID=2583531 RepID=A0A5C4LKH5_9HYPH|nr:hypothetical protein [Methylobacterium terricola]TNC14924.1 hypothetical protein FF100_04940 [Methylobacterium terricola]